MLLPKLPPEMMVGWRIRCRRESPKIKAIRKERDEPKQNPCTDRGDGAGIASAEIREPAVPLASLATMTATKAESPKGTSEFSVPPPHWLSFLLQPRSPPTPFPPDRSRRSKIGPPSSRPWKAAPARQIQPPPRSHFQTCETPAAHRARLT